MHTPGPIARVPSLIILERQAEEAARVAGPLFPIAPDARKGKPPCGECHLRAGETCDICGAHQAAASLHPQG